jgi:acetyltransferase
MHNLIDGGFKGTILPVNPKDKAVHGVIAYPTIASLPIVPDLAVIAIPPQGVIQAIRELIVKGARAVVILTAGLEIAHNEKGQTLQDEAAEVARAGGIRLLGPNCIGLMVPPLGLNASFAPQLALPGTVAFVSQSGALCTGIVDWATSNDIGFSHFVSIGNAVETDIGDIIEYLDTCPQTSAILLYMESIVDAPKFIAAARKASRTKPILAIKSGSSESGAKAAASHTGALAGSDKVYAAALARAGILRVKTFEEMFEAMSTLARNSQRETKQVKNERLAILTNGGGSGVLSVDALSYHGGQPTTLSPETIAKLDAALPATWSHGNPVDILGDASVERYAETFKILVDAPEVDSILVMHCPIAVVSATGVAQAIVKTIKDSGTLKPVSTCWLGEKIVAEARQVFSENGIPGYATPETMVRGYMNIVNFHRNQDLLDSEESVSYDTGIKVDKSAVRAIIDQSLAKGVTMLNEHDAKSVLKAYGIPIADTRIVKTPEEAAKAAKEIGFPVVLKILSDDISHKSDAGGVVLDLVTEQEVNHAAIVMNQHITSTLPNARLNGFTVQNMIKRPNAQELIVGMSTDRVFGPTILFGQGGVSVEVVKDSAVALLPVNIPQAKDLIGRTRISKLLAGYRDRLPADILKIATSLCSISQLVTDFPEIKELDINPLLADDEGVVALDARISVKPKS